MRVTPILLVLCFASVLLGGCAVNRKADSGAGPELVELISEGSTGETGEVRMRRSFDEALVSVNLDIEDGAWAVVEMCVGRLAAPGRAEFWSPWLRLGTWGSGSADEPSLREFSDQATGLGGKIDVDYFRAAPGSWFDGVRGRIRHSEKGVRVRRELVCATNERGWTPREPMWKPSREVAMDVPFRSQKTPDASLSGRLCSPTSVAMVLAFRGVDVPVSEVARRTYDAPQNIYGNWPRNVQAAYELGVPGYLIRFARWADVERCFAAGQPIIASIIAGPGELRNAPYQKTGGHLIVLRGFDRHGRVLVNDPAAGDAAGGMRAYERADLTNVWMYRTGGTAYVLMKPERHSEQTQGARP